MPTLNLNTNVPVDSVVASDILKDATKIVARTIGKPESVGDLFSLSLRLCPPAVWWNYSVNFIFHLIIKCCDSSICLKIQYVMIVLNGGVPMAFAGSEEPAAYGEVISIGGLGPGVNGKLCLALADLLQTKLAVDSSRFYIKFYDVEVSN